MLANPRTWENNPDASEAEPWLKVPRIEVDPVTPKLPDMIALPVNGNGFEAILGAHDADNAWVAYDAVPSSEPVNPRVEVVDPVTINEPVILAEPVYGNDAPSPPAFNACDAVRA